MISLDYTFMTSPAVGGGLTDAELRAAEADFTIAQRAIGERHAAGALGFLDLPGNEALLAQSVAVASMMRERRHTDVVVLGIGGSALGPLALRTALRPSGWNALGDDARDGYPRLHVLDNIDPVTVGALLDRLDVSRTLFLVVSKSGGTAETMAQYLIVRGRMAATGQSAGDHLVFVTDPEKGALRALARAEGIVAIDIPPAVGGRFSVLSPVGVLPAALTGIDVSALLAGAGHMRERCASPELFRNPAGLFAVVQWLAHANRQRGIHVMMPYADPLRDLADWFVQLWAESLGKERSDGANVGPTPIAALGATDQHSQVQLFMEGPQDKTVTFVVAGETPVDLPIPGAPAASPDLAYLAGHSLSQLLAVEQRATAAALAKRGRLNMTIRLDRVDPWHVGGLLMLLELATAYAGELYAVDAYDQPGVELGKRFTYALLGRPGFDDARREWEALPRSDPSRIV
jgi:glucose-6-phosphate isomerase